MRRRTTKAMRDELKEIDYLHKLSPKDRSFLMQFMFEFYQADFNWPDVIHPPDLVKDCRDRNNASKRQIHSVGSEILGASVTKIREAHVVSPNTIRYYRPEEYLKDHDYLHQEDDE